MLAAVGDTTYNVFALLHILSAMVAFAPAFVAPFVGNRLVELPATERSAVWSYFQSNSRRVHGPALIVTGILGFGLSGMSEGIYALSKGWLIASIVIWIAMNGVLHAILYPAERALAGGDDSAKPRLDRFGAVMALLLLVMLYLMVFKPGQ